MSNKFSIILILAIILLSIAIGINALTGRYKVYVEKDGLFSAFIKVDTWTGKVYTTTLPHVKEKGWKEVKKQ